MAEKETKSRDGYMSPLSFFYLHGMTGAGLSELEDLANGVSPLSPSDGVRRATKEEIIQGGDPRQKIRLLVAAHEIKERGREHPLTGAEKKELKKSVTGWGKFKTCSREAEVSVKIGRQAERLFNDVSSSLSVLTQLLNRREDWRERVRYLSIKETGEKREEVARKMTEILRLEIEATVTPGQGEGGANDPFCSTDGVLRIEQTEEGYSLNEDGIRALIETEAKKAEKALAEFKAFAEEVDKYIKQTTLQYYPLFFVWSVRQAIGGGLAVSKRPVYNAEYIYKIEGGGGRVPPGTERADIVPSFVEIEAPEDARAEAWELIRAAEEELLETKETEEDTPSRPPKTFMITREAALKLPGVEGDLFSETENDPSIKYKVSGEIFKKITPKDFSAFSFAISQILYNQSTRSGNGKTNSGIERIREERLSKDLGQEVYKGRVEVSLNEIVRLAYGTQAPTLEQRRKVETTLSVLHRYPVKITLPNGDIWEAYLCATQEVYNRKKDNAKFYSLVLHPIFSISCNGYGVLPQDVIFKLDEFCKANGRNKSAEDYKLLRWLSIQDKRHPHTLTIQQIIKITGQGESFRKDRGRAEKKLLLTFAAMVGVGILTNYEIEHQETAKGNRINKVIFYLNKDYTKEQGPQYIEEAAKD